MPDRRRRTAFRQPLPERTSLLMRERQSPTGSSSPSPSSSSGSSSSSSGQSDDNPFAAPPENRPDQPWQPRRPTNTGNENGRGEGEGEGDGSSEGGSSGDRPVWGGQWSSKQPGRQSGGFGGRPGGQGGPNGQGGPEGGSGGMRWDPTDPAQRRARYALLSGMWAFFFALFDFPEIALLLGALAVYWAISALRSKPKSATATGAAAAGSAPAPGSAPAAGAAASGRAPAPGAVPGAPAAPVGGRQQTTAAVSGLVTALLALSIVATTFTVQLVYRDYYTCVNDALTKTGQLSCNDQLPKPLEPFFGVKD
ncbi:hypothetical protein [Streptomyces sp. NBC_01435]|uniref:hypothetical protein n=1 Tax=Streptomyces sp. NBC_01435 TaxID=2903865 RepID=UPI002E3525FF|nr:hypothetical protein [Streptomyces sp. NBC_01435]